MPSAVVQEAFHPSQLGVEKDQPPAMDATTGAGSGVEAVKKPFSYRPEIESVCRHCGGKHVGSCSLNACNDREFR